MSTFKPSSLALPFIYSPSQEAVDQKYPTYLPMGKRRIFVFKADGEDQYMVFKQGFNAESDPSCKNVVGSGFTPEHALYNARGALSRAALSPADFMPRLGGCTFTTAKDKTSVLKHVVLDTSGFELGRSEYREVACKQALHRLLIGAEDATLEEFKEIAVLVNIERGGSDSYGWLYADAEGQEAVRQLVLNGFKSNVSFRDAAARCLELRKQIASRRPIRALSRHAQRRVDRQDRSPLTAEENHEAELFSALLDQVNEYLLSQPEGNDLIISPLKPEDGQWIGEIVAHTSRISPQTALRNAYEQFVAEARASTQVHTPEEVELEEASSPVM